MARTRIKFYENFEDDDEIYDFSKPKKKSDESHPWEADYEDLPFWNPKGKVEEEEEDEDFDDFDDFDDYPTSGGDDDDDDQENYITPYIESLLKERGLVSSVTLTGNDIEVMVVMEKECPFSELASTMNLLKDMSYLEELKDYTTNVSVWKSTKDSPLIILDLIYKPYTKTYYKTTTKKL